MADLLRRWRSPKLQADGAGTTEQPLAPTTADDQDDASGPSMSAPAESLDAPEEANGRADEDAAPPAGGSSSDDTVVTRRAWDEPSEEAAGSAASLQVAQRCHVGLQRSRNEDSTFAFSVESGGQEPLLPFGLYVIADGMGGHHAGHRASRTAARTVARHVLERIYLPLLQEGDDSPPNHEPIGAVMHDAVQQANDELHSPDPDKDSGTTLTAALFLGRRLHVTHVGDSRAYLFTGDQLKQLTTDHSYVWRMQVAGQITAEEAAYHPQRNMLYNAVGQGGGLTIDTYTQMLPEEGKLLLCSDGLWGLVPQSVMEEVISGDDVQQMADKLVEFALAAGGADNISVIIIRFRF